MKAICTAALAAVILFFAIPSSAETNQSRGLNLSTLQPGQFREINQELKINVVFIGFERGDGFQQVNEERFRAYLPRRQRAVDLSYGVEPGSGEAIGNSFDLSYNTVYAQKWFEDEFFSFLDGNREPCQVDIFQQYYNNDPAHSLTITENFCIDSSQTEKWLADKAGRLGVDTSQYTVFLINWWGRPDFRFHVYYNMLNSDVDPDTGFNIAHYQGSGASAWGGTTPDDEQNGLGTLRRVWFYDVSAGPDYNSTNYDLSIPDFDMDGNMEYRIPPIWEYGNMSGYRPFDTLSEDLSYAVRYAAVNGQFTAPSLVHPAGFTERLPSTIQANLIYFNDDPPYRGQNVVTPGRARDEWNRLKPLNLLTINERELPFTEEHRAAYQCSLPWWSGVFTNCFPGASTPDVWDMDLYHASHLNEYSTGNADQQTMNFVYTVSPEDSIPGLLGFGPGFTYNFNVQERTGMTHTVIHEGGHSFGKNHPFVSYDFEEDFAHGPSSNYVNWLADATDSAMSYLRLANNFSQFDRDNQNRWMTAISINKANELLPGILANEQHRRFYPDLQTADNEASQALAAYQAMDYRAAIGFAKRAYDRILRVADQLGVQPTALQKPAGYREPFQSRERPIMQGVRRLRERGYAAAQGPAGRGPIPSGLQNDISIETERFDPLKRLRDPFFELRKNPANKNPMLSEGKRLEFLKAVPDRPTKN